MSIVFVHCPKTGGTTLKNRYSDYVTDLRTNDAHYNFYRRVHYNYYNNDYLQHNDMVCSSKIQIHKLIKNPHVHLVTCLRDPITWVMSAYNYSNYLLLNAKVRPNFIYDFYTWFINREFMRPFSMGYSYTYDFFLSRKKYINYDKAITNDLIGNLNTYKQTVMGNDPHVHTEDEQKQKELMQKENMNLCLNEVMSHFDHILFAEDNIVEDFDNIIKEYNIDAVPNEKRVKELDSANMLKEFNQSYLHFEDLDDELKEIVKLDLKYDIEFYNICRDKWHG